MSFSDLDKYPVANKKGKCLVFSYERKFPITAKFSIDVSEENGKKYEDCLKSFGFETKHFNEIAFKDVDRVLDENLKDISDFTVLMIVVYGGLMNFSIMDCLRSYEIPKIILLDTDDSDSSIANFYPLDILHDVMVNVEEQKNILFYTVFNDDDFVDEFCKVFKSFRSDNFLDYFVKLNDCVEKNKLEGGYRGNFICNMNRKITFEKADAVEC